MQLTDTTPEAERILRRIYRGMSAERKFAILQEAWQGARQMHAVGCRLRQPAASAADILADWLDVTLGLSVRPISEAVVEELNAISARVLDVIHVLDDLRIGYALGGSMASSIHGKPRFTQDADLTAEPFPGQEKAFVASFAVATWYVSLEAVERAIRERASFNVIHTASGFKIDVFIRKATPFDESAFARRLQAALTNESISILSAEDIILYKLDWYRIGGEVSDRQWNDILGVLQVQEGRLDIDYLKQWAEQLGLADLFAKAAADANQE